MGNDLTILPDGKIISMAFGPKYHVTKELRKSAVSEWTRRMNERNEKIVSERFEEIKNEQN